MSVALYDDDTWTLGNSEEKKLLAFKAWYYRKLLKISWIDHITNLEVFRIIGVGRSFLKAMKIRRAKSIRHKLRHNIGN